MAEVWCQKEHANAMWAVFWIDEVCFRYKLFHGKVTRQDVIVLNWHNVEADACIALLVKHTCELIFQPSIVVKCIYTDVLTILLFRTNWSFKGGGSVVVDSLLIAAPIVGFCVCSIFCCSLLCVLSSFAIILMGKRELVALLCLPGVL